MKKFLMSPVGLVVAAVAIVILTLAYGNRAPAFAKTVASKLPGSQTPA
jgi:hypothetical protein